MILREMRLITKKMKEKDDDEVVISDWKFAAMVIDRCYLMNCKITRILGPFGPKILALSGLGST